MPANYPSISKLTSLTFPSPNIAHKVKNFTSTSRRSKNVERTGRVKSMTKINSKVVDKREINSEEARCIP